MKLFGRQVSEVKASSTITLGVKHLIQGLEENMVHQIIRKHIEKWPVYMNRKQIITDCDKIKKPSTSRISEVGGSFY